MGREFFEKSFGFSRGTTCGVTRGVGMDCTNLDWRETVVASIIIWS
jgi:hypothetical protein